MNASRIGVFQMYKIGIGPSSSHTVGPMRAGLDFINRLSKTGLLSGTTKTNLTPENSSSSSSSSSSSNGGGDDIKHGGISVHSELFGSLAYTGDAHGTLTAVLLGLMGNDPATFDPINTERLVDECKETKTLKLGGKYNTPYMAPILHYHNLPYHTNGMRFTALGHDSEPVLVETYFSIGGGFVMREKLCPSSDDTRKTYIYTSLDNDPGEEEKQDDTKDGDNKQSSSSSSSSGPSSSSSSSFPVQPTEEYWDFDTGYELVQQCLNRSISVSDLMLHNEIIRTKEAEWNKSHTWISDEAATEAINVKCDSIWDVMKECVQRGCLHDEGVLPGSIKLERRAPRLYKRLRHAKVNQITIEDAALGALQPNMKVNLYAMAVGEQNAAGGRVVTAPTNGAAGIIPAVMTFCDEVISDKSEFWVRDFLMAAAAVGALVKKHATLSGAEGGCQAEVGTACAMAAAGLVQVVNGTPQQLEKAAEIGLEHNFGLTCDPVAGLVQVPCIERNAMASIKAINSAGLAVFERCDEEYKPLISLDKAIRVLKRCGDDMAEKYKETSLGGLALEFPDDMNTINQTNC